MIKKCETVKKTSIHVMMMTMTMMMTMMMIVVRGHVTVERHQDKRGCLLDALNVRHGERMERERRKRRRLGGEFGTDQIEQFDSLRCANNWGQHSECFIPEVTSAYVDSMERGEMPVVNLRIRSNAFASSTGARLISDQDIEALVNASAERYERDSKIRLVHLGIQVVTNNTLYNRKFFSNTQEELIPWCSCFNFIFS